MIGKHEMIWTISPILIKILVWYHPNIVTHYHIDSFIVDAPFIDQINKSFNIEGEEEDQHIAWVVGEKRPAIVHLIDEMTIYWIQAPKTIMEKGRFAFLVDP